MGNLPENILVIVIVAAVGAFVSQVTNFLLKLLVIAALIGFLYYVYLNYGNNVFHIATDNIGLVKGML